MLDGFGMADQEWIGVGGGGGGGGYPCYNDRHIKAKDHICPILSSALVAGEQIYNNVFFSEKCLE